MFHKGALLENVNGMLEGDGEETRVDRFSDIEDLEFNLISYDRKLILQ